MIIQQDKNVSVTLKIPETLYQQVEILFPNYRKMNVKNINKNRLLEAVLVSALNNAAKSYREFYLNQKLSINSEVHTSE